MIIPPEHKIRLYWVVIATLFGYCITFFFTIGWGLLTVIFVMGVVETIVEDRS